MHHKVMAVYLAGHFEDIQKIRIFNTSSWPISRNTHSGIFMTLTMTTGKTHLSQFITVFLRSKMRALVGLMCWSLVLLLAMGLSSCEREGALLDESQYQTMLVGDWQGTVGDERETISFGADGGFTARLFPMGFINRTLAQGVVGTISGTWTIQGKVITLIIDSTENEQTLNLATTSTIVTFKQNQLVIKSTGGGTSTFLRTTGS